MSSMRCFSFGAQPKIKYTVLEQKLVYPCVAELDEAAASHFERVVECSGVDETLLVKNTTLPWALFYRFRLDPERLALSLARVLLKFPVLAGRLRAINGETGEQCAQGLNVKMQIVCRNQGVPFTVAESNAKAEDFYMNSPATECPANDRPPEFVDMLTPAKYLGGKEPLLKIRLTYLSDGGCILGANMPHILGDGFSFVEFLRALSLDYAVTKAVTDASGGGSATSSTDGRTPSMVKSSSAILNELIDEPSHERLNWLATAPEGIPPFPVGELERLTLRSLGWKLFLITYRGKHLTMSRELVYLSTAQLKQMKDYLMTFCAGGEFISTNDVIVTFTWRLLRQIRGRPLGNAMEWWNWSQPEPRIIQTVNMRGRVPGMSNSMFGNGAFVMWVDARRGMPAVDMAKECRKAVQEWNGEEKASRKAGAIKGWNNLSTVNQVKAQIHPAFSDGFLTAWQFPIWDVDFGEEGAYWFYASVHPQTAWTIFVTPAAPVSATTSAGGSQSDATPSASALSTSHDIASDTFCTPPSPKPISAAAFRKSATNGAGGWSGQGVYLNLTIPKHKQKEVQKFAEMLKKEMTGENGDDKKVK